MPIAGLLESASWTINCDPPVVDCLCWTKILTGGGEEGSFGGLGWWTGIGGFCSLIPKCIEKKVKKTLEAIRSNNIIILQQGEVYNFLVTILPR